MVYGSPGSVELAQAAQQVRASASQPPASAAPAVSKPQASGPAVPPVKAPRASVSPASAAAPQSSAAPFSVLLSREEEPSNSSPLSYREYAFAIPEGSTEQDAEVFITERFEDIKQKLSSARPGKLVNLAVFDHEFQGKPKRPPLATLVWKDWKGDAEIRFPSRPGVSIPPPSLGKPTSMPPAGFLQTSQPPPASAQPSNPPPAAPQPSPNIATPPSTPTALRNKNPGNLGPPQATLRSAEAPAAAEPAPPPVQVVEPVLAPVKQEQKPVPPAPRPAQPPRVRTPIPVGDEVIADIFEAMHDLHFLRDAYEGADFVVALAADKLRCTLGMAQLYDINRREFVVAHAIGPGAEQTLGNRTAEQDPLLVEIMQRRTPFVVEAAKDERVKSGRWQNLGGEPHSILACSVAQGGRFLGILEVGRNGEARNFSKAEIEGLAYIATSFAEFVATKGLTFGSEESLLPR